MRKVKNSIKGFKGMLCGKTNALDCVKGLGVVITIGFIVYMSYSISNSQRIQSGDNVINRFFSELIILVMFYGFIMLINMFIIHKCNPETADGLTNRELLYSELKIPFLINFIASVIVFIITYIFDLGVIKSLIVDGAIMTLILNLILLINQVLLNKTKYEISDGELEYFNMTNLYKPIILKYNHNIILYGSLVVFGLLMIIEQLVSKRIKPIVHGAEVIFILNASYIWIIFIFNLIKAGAKSLRNTPFEKILTKLDVQVCSIEETEIMNSLIYYKFSKQNKGVNNVTDVMYKLNLEDIIPVSSTNQELYFEGFQVPILYNGSQKKYIDNANRNVLVLSSFDYKQQFKVDELKVHTSYLPEGSNKRVYKYFHLFVCFKQSKGVIVPVQKYLYDYKKEMICVKNWSPRSYATNAMVDIEDIHDRILLATREMCVYNKSSETENSNDSGNILNQDIMDNRKVVAHIKDFGTGKTAYDINTVVNSKKIPVVISPWEANYDHDILHLIFSELKKEVPSNELSNSPNAAKVIYLVGILAAINLIVVILGNILGENNKLFYLIDNIISLEPRIHILYMPAIIMICVVGLMNFFTRNVDELLIFKKDSTQVYKDFYVNNIVEMLRKNPNYVFVIEDVDRLDAKVIVEVFRILSSINSKLPSKGRIFAVISYCEEKMIKKLSTLENISESMYSELVNKVVYLDNWGIEYDPSDSMFEYSMVNLKMIERHIQANEVQSFDNSISLITKEKEEQVKKVIENNQLNINFRDIRSACESITKPNKLKYLNHIDFDNVFIKFISALEERAKINRVSIKRSNR